MGVARENPADLLKNVGLRIVELRSKRGWSREDLAERLNISVRYISRIEAGGQNLTVHRLAWLAGKLGVRVVELFAEPGIDRIQVGRPRKK